MRIVDGGAAIANGDADSAAGMGLKTAGHDDLQQLAGYFGRKQNAYIQLFTAIVNRIACVAA